MPKVIQDIHKEEFMTYATNIVPVISEVIDEMDGFCTVNDVMANQRVIEQMKTLPAHLQCYNAQKVMLQFPDFISFFEGGRCATAKGYEQGYVNGDGTVNAIAKKGNKKKNKKPKTATATTTTTAPVTTTKPTTTTGPTKPVQGQKKGGKPDEAKLQAQLQTFNQSVTKGSVQDMEQAFKELMTIRRQLGLSAQNAKNNSQNNNQNSEAVTETEKPKGKGKGGNADGESKPKGKGKGKGKRWGGKKGAAPY